VAVGGPTLAQLIDPRTREGALWEPLAGGRLRCVACGHRCVIPPGQRGVCKVRSMSSPVPAVGAGCGVIAIVQDPAVVRTLLAHDGRARSPAAPGPAPPPPAALG